MVMVCVFNPPANEIAQLTVFVGGRHQNATVGEVFQNPIDGRQADTLEPLFSFTLGGKSLPWRWIFSALASLSALVAQLSPDTRGQHGKSESAFLLGRTVVLAG
jgi:hypothetical protein